MAAGRILHQEAALIIRLDPPIPVSTPRGDGLAIFLRDYGIEHDDYWTVVLSNGEFWTFNNREIRADKNYTIGRTSISPIRQRKPTSR